MVPIIIIIIIILNKRHRCEEKVELDQQNYWLIAATRTLNEIKKEKMEKKNGSKSSSFHSCCVYSYPNSGCWLERKHALGRTRVDADDVFQRCEAQQRLRRNACREQGRRSTAITICYLLFLFYLVFCCYEQQRGKEERISIRTKFDSKPTHKG